MTAKVELLTPSGGKVILDPTDTAVDRVLTLPAVAGTVLNTASDIEAQVKTATSATGDAPIFSCRAWVNFNGTGTVAIRASGNVSSITDNGVGNYTVNFATAMPDVNYATVFSLDSDLDIVNNFSIAADARLGFTQQSLNTNGSVRVFTGAGAPTGSTPLDFRAVNVAIFR